MLNRSVIINAYFRLINDLWLLVDLLLLIIIYAFKIYTV